MEEQGLWNLFLATGRPEAYLALCARRLEKEAAAENARTAFEPQKAEKQKV